MPGDTYTSSIPVLALLLALAVFGSGLGLWTWIGFVVGDTVRPQPDVFLTGLDAFVQVRIPLMITYALLAILLVLSPLTSQAMRRQLFPWAGHLHRERPRLDLLTGAAEALLQGLLQGGLAWVWLQSIPLLIRPLYTWAGGPPPVGAIQPLQDAGQPLLVVAAVGGVARIAVVRLAARRQAVTRRLAALQSTLNRSPAQSLGLPLWLVLPLQAALLTLLLAGVMEDWASAFAVFVGLLAARALRILIGTYGGPVAAVMEMIPSAIRLAVGGLIAYYATANLLVAQGAAATLPLLGQLQPGLFDAQLTATSFRPAIVALLASAFILALLTPDRRLVRERSQRSPAATTGAGATALLLGTSTALVVALVPRVVEAHNCGSLSDCWLTIAVAALAIVAIALLIYFAAPVILEMAAVEGAELGAAEVAGAEAAEAGAAEAAGTGAAEAAGTGAAEALEAEAGEAAAAEAGAAEINSVDNVLDNPSLLEGKSPGEVRDALGEVPGWQQETLGQGTHEGQGWVLREYDANGNPTGRVIRWHPGGGRHGTDPYWRVSSPRGGKSDIIRGGPDDL
jgi:hypothetical protein